MLRAESCVRADNKARVHGVFSPFPVHHPPQERRPQTALPLCKRKSASWVGSDPFQGGSGQVQTHRISPNSSSASHVREGMRIKRQVYRQPYSPRKIQASKSCFLMVLCDHLYLSGKQTTHGTTCILASFSLL